MTSYHNDIDWEALLYALAAQTEALPETLKQAHANAVNASVNQRSEAIHRLRQQIEQYPTLETAYRDGLKQVARQNRTQHRAKGIGATLSAPQSFENILSLVFQSPNPIAEAKRHLRTQPITSVPSNQFWEKSDRLVIMTIGGVACGMAVAQIPGAIVGGLIAVACWYYVTFININSTQNP